MKFETIIFDFDGTLLYTVEDLAAAVNHGLSESGYPTHSVKKVERMIGNGVRMLISRALPGGFENPDYDRVFADFRSFYQAHCFDTTRPYDGIDEMLLRFKAEGRKMAIVTNKYQLAAEELRRRFFSDTIPLIVGDLEGRARKPAPDGTYAAMEALGASQDSTVYVGDTEVDMETAENAGVAFCAVEWGYRTRRELEGFGIKRIAAAPAELCELI